MNRVEVALMHALFLHLHHNIGQAVDFEAIAKLNAELSRFWGEELLKVGPGDDAAVFRIPGIDGWFVAKMESHCSPAAVRPYDSAATGVSGAVRDVTAMGGRAVFLMDFVGTQSMDNTLLVGPCSFAGECTCGKCIEMTSKERLDLIMLGVRDMCAALDVFIIGGGLSTSFTDIVPAVVVAVIGKLVVAEPLTKPAKAAGDKLILVGATGKDGNDTLFRAGLVSEMHPAVALFTEEKQVMEATLAAIQTGLINACSDLGAAGIGAGVCEAARYGGFGAMVDLSLAPFKADLTPEEIVLCETQGRMLLQVKPGDVDEVLQSIPESVPVAVIGEITDSTEEVFVYENEVVATIPNEPSPDVLAELREGA